MTGSLQDPPITFSQSRTRLFGVVLGGLVALFVGLTMQPNHWMVDGLFPAEWVLIPVGAVFTAAGLMALVWPGRLTLAPEGVEYSLLLSTRRIPWPAIQDVGLWSYRGRESVSLRLNSSRPLRLASGWPVDARELASLILQARAQWMAPGEPLQRSRR